MTHTPGPLRINGQAIMLSRRNIGRAFVTPETDIATALANARLWGTAPELLEALKEIQWSDAGWCPQCAYGPSIGHQENCILGNAIAKAEGRQ